LQPHVLTEVNPSFIGMYTFYDDNISLEDYYSGVSEQQLVYADPKKDPALVRDLIVLIKGPEKGRTGTVI